MVGFLAQSAEEIESNFDQLSECCDIVEVSCYISKGATPDVILTLRIIFQSFFLLSAQIRDFDGI